MDSGVDISAMMYDGPGNASHSVVLAHGAGAPMDSPFMNHMAEGLGENGIRTVRFEFPYMAARRKGGGRKPPGSPKKLLGDWRTVVEHLGDPSHLVIGGKSMGGRLASMLADELGVAGLICLGYPFHPPGRPEKLRTEHLEALSTPALFVQGERDALGDKAEVAGYRLSERIRLVWLPDGDHSFKPRKASGETETENLRRAVAACAEFVREVL